MRGCAHILLVGLALALPTGAATVGDPVASRSAEALEHYEAGRFQEALTAYRDALLERPESASLRLNVGDALYELGEYEAALEEFERVAAAEDPALAAQGHFCPAHPLPPHRHRFDLSPT